MKMKYKKQLKFSGHLVVGDHIRVGGLMCIIEKVETVFHHTPDSRIRLQMEIVGATPKTGKVLLFLPHAMPITVLE